MPLAVVFLPLVAAIIAGFFGRAIGDRGSQLVTCGALLVSAVLGIVVFRDILAAPGPQIIPLFQWIVAGGVDVTWSIRLDTLSGGDDPRRHHRLVDGPCLFDRLHGRGQVDPALHGVI